MATRGVEAQVGDADVGNVAGMLALFPSTRGLPAPDFIKPGVRVTYESGAASAGGAGGGYIIYDVLARDGAHVLSNQQNYLYTGSGFSLASVRPLRGYPGIGDFWLQPSVLADAEQFASSTLTITRTDKTLGDGTPVSVVRFQTRTSSGTTVYEYDTKTGVKVFESLFQNGSMAQLRLMNVRTLTLPWDLGRAPNWARPAATWSYSGTRGVAIAGTTTTQPLTSSASVSEAGAAWTIVNFAGTLNGSAVPAWSEAVGHGQLGDGLWLPDTALNAQLSDSPERFDLDPYTVAELYVWRESSGAVVVERVTSDARTTRTYHPTLLVLDSFKTVQQDLSAVTTTEITRTGGDAALEALAMQAPLPDDPDDPPLSTGGMMTAGSGGTLGSGGAMGGGMAASGGMGSSTGGAGSPGNAGGDVSSGGSSSSASAGDGGSSDSGGCSVGRSGGGTAHGLPLLAATLSLGLRRRRRP